MEEADNDIQVGITTATSRSSASNEMDHNTNIKPHHMTGTATTNNVATTISAENPDNNGEKNDAKKNDTPNSTAKRIKTNKTIITSPVVNGFTERIRSLRLRSAMTLENGSAVENRTSQLSVKNSQLSTPSSLHPPRFLKPTINSLNKTKNSTHKTSIIDTPKHSNPTKHTLTKSTSLSLVSLNHKSSNMPFSTSRNISTSASIPVQKLVPKSAISSSVFDRLYSQNTMSKSISMNNVSVNNSKPTNATESQSSLNRNTVRSSNIMSRSGTSRNISRHLQNETRSTSKSKKPVWR